MRPIKHNKVDDQENKKFGNKYVSNKNGSSNNETLILQFETMMKQYYDNEPYKTTTLQNHEIEVRFGNKNSKSFTKSDYDNVIKRLLSIGFVTDNTSGYNSLRIKNEFMDPKTGKFRISSIRTEINGIHNIQQYCKTNDLSEQKNVRLTSKLNVKNKKGEPIPMFINNNFNFRVSYQIEENILSSSSTYKSIVNNWTNSKKMFRYIQRTTYTHPDYPVIVDMSVVKKQADEYKTYKTLQESELLNSNESFEIEIEIDNSKIGPQTKFNNSTILLSSLKNVINFVLGGLQNTLFPCSYPEQQEVIQSYMSMVHTDYNRYNVYSKHFVGPNLYTLQIKNIVEEDENNNIPNIRKNYTVTEKADGLRCLLYVYSDGKVYLINTNMNVIFTGSITHEKTLFNTIIDGELVSNDKRGNYINLYVAFDIYYVNNKDVRSYPLIPYKKDVDKSRYYLLKKLVTNIKLKLYSRDNNYTKELTPSIRIKCKDFYPNNPETDNIFESANIVLTKERDNLFEYETDGLIFTPAYLGVGSNKMGVAGPTTKITWEHLFKWKPPQFNTIDFLVTTIKNTNGQDKITPIYEDGINTLSDNQYNEYKTIELRCSFIESQHGYINPCQDVINDVFPQFKSEEDSQSKLAKPMRFYPSDPPDPNAGICNIMLKSIENSSKQMISIENQAFTDNTIVEFSYDLTKEPGWRWVPLRVRYDKTAELRQGGTNFGNAYHVADSNWYSIHYPITEEMISTGLNIHSVENDIYYNKIGGESKTRGLRDFHNLYVKSMLFKNVSKKGDICIDYTCGKAGDLPKWIASNLSFVFGIDISKDNLENRINGACSRFLNNKKTHKHMPYALFVNGDSSKNIKSGEAMLNDKAIQITKAIFGEIENDEETLGKGVSRQYGKGKDGFNISSCQFSIHYFFKNINTLKGFLTNLSECTKIGGYFIGTCYDGKEVFDLLKNKNTEESVQISIDNKKIWEIVKQYNSDVFNADDTSLGYKIDVYQETINQLITEYLVNFEYFERIMENYGFILLDRTEAKTLGFSDSTGLFSDLFINLLNELNLYKFKSKDYGDASKMSEYEKKISFLNRYFVFKKIRNVIIENVIIDTSEPKYEDDINRKNAPISNKVVKLNIDLLLEPSSEALLEEIPNEETEKTDINIIQEPAKEPEIEEEEITEIVPKKRKTKPKMKKPVLSIIDDEEELPKKEQEKENKEEDITEIVPKKRKTKKVKLQITDEEPLQSPEEITEIVPKKRKTKKATLQITEEEPPTEVKPKKRIIKKVKLNIMDDKDEDK